VDYGIVTSLAGIPSVKIGEVSVVVTDVSNVSNTNPVSTPPSSTPRPFAEENLVSKIIIPVIGLTSAVLLVGCSVLALRARKSKSIAPVDAETGDTQHQIVSNPNKIVSIADEGVGSDLPGSSSTAVSENIQKMTDHDVRSSPSVELKT